MKPQRTATPLFADDFFVPIPGEVYTAMEEGQLTPAMWCVYCLVLRQVDFETGVWRGSAYRIWDGTGGQMPLRTVQQNLAELCRCGLLKTFHVKNSRGNYPVLVNGYRVRFGPKKGYRLNAQATEVPWKKRPTCG